MHNAVEDFNGEFGRKPGILFAGVTGLPNYANR